MYPRKFLKRLDIDTLRDLFSILEDARARAVVRHEIRIRLGIA